MFQNYYKAGVFMRIWKLMIYVLTAMCILTVPANAACDAACCTIQRYACGGRCCDIGETCASTGIDKSDSYYASSKASEVVRQVNAERAAYGLSELREDPELTRAAYIRAQEIIKFFSHTRPDGTNWSTVSASARGENIAKGYRTADKVMAAWLTSAGHRRNILRSSFSAIGVCAIEYDGVTYWVQLFGK